MLKKLCFAFASAYLAASLAWADVDINKADQSQLESIKGIGPAMSQRILDERKKVAFKDWADLEARVKGISEKNAAKYSDAGLTVNGKPKSISTDPAKK